jgi:hypothetical protein
VPAGQPCVGKYSPSKVSKYSWEFNTFWYIKKHLFCIFDFNCHELQKLLKLK